MKKILIFALFFIFVANTNAQQTSLSAGSNAFGSGGSISYSVGQVVYTTNTGVTASMAQGVQQPFEISTLGIDEHPEIVLNFKAYPNPTNSKLTLDISDYDSSHLSYQLIDLSGRVLENNNISGNITTINMESRTTAIYFIKITDQNKEIKTFKIIKN